jgi:hypothetical protein
MVLPSRQRSFCEHQLSSFVSSLDTKLLLEELKWQLASQPPPRLITQKQSHEIELQTVR